MGVVGSYPARYQDSPSIETDGSARYVSKSQPEPGLGRVKTSDSRSAVSMPLFGVGCNRKALYAMVADRALPVLMVGICGLGSKEIRGVGRYEGHSGAERMRSGERDWGERAGFDPASATLGAVASRRIERGSAFPPHHANTGRAGGPGFGATFFGTSELVPCYKSGSAGIFFSHRAELIRCLRWSDCEAFRRRFVHAASAPSCPCGHHPTV
jgi:hypothetical protein